MSLDGDCMFFLKLKLVLVQSFVGKKLAGVEGLIYTDPQRSGRTLDYSVKAATYITFTSRSSHLSPH